MTRYGAKPVKTIDYRYRFVLGAGVEKEISIRLDSRTMNVVSERRESYPRWTELTFHQCSNCRLEETLDRYCPIAVNVHDLIEDFKDCASFDEADLFIDCESRRYMRHTVSVNVFHSMPLIVNGTAMCVRLSLNYCR